MKRRLPSLSALRSFEAAARLQSFKLAAEELSVSATSISHQVRALEEALEVRLFLRKTRAVELTAEGRILLQATGNGLDAIAAGVERLRREQRRTVTLSTTPSFAARWLVPRLASFNAAHPGIALNIQASNSPVDLAGGAADLAVRGGGGHFAGLHAQRLLRAGFAPVASPRLKLRKASDVARHPLIHFDWQRGLKSAITWDKWAKAAGIALDLSAGAHFSEESHAVQAAIAGQGVVLTALPLVREEIGMGLLEAPVGPVLGGFDFYVVRPEGDDPRDEVRAVEAWLLAQEVQ
ncbi:MULTISPECIES: LysR substrate-binding domain-containing protein [unclassified Duganella]|uniref:LysR substrate-binding domain-containing protein n=1 Tax=unclassified Duganella TaxID=2636909 RepID=UPI000AE97ABA|nr:MULTISPECIES: LysR substrate-binding domain-containing protein [unclassified Duganella]